MSENKWQSSAGPRQTKAVNEAIKALNWRGKSYTEITDYGQSSFTSLGSGPSEQCQAEMLRIGEQFGWQVTRENYREVVAAFEAATKALVLPVVDKRSTPEERAEREQQRLEQQQRDAARNAALEASKAKLLPKVPSWADALIVAELDEDQSDSMTDYFSHKTTRRVLIGFRKGKREDFRQLRAAAGQFPETAHMGPGKGDFTIRAKWAENCPEYRHYAGAPAPCGYDLDGQTFDNRAAAEEAIANSTEEMELSYQGANGLLTGRVEYKILEEEIEHRENYSMGGGNYLKSGSRHSNGWKVRSRDLSELNRDAFEDGLPVAKSVESASPAAPVVGGSFRIEQHRHTKRGFDMFIVVLTDRVERDRFEELRSSCEAAGGWYSRQWGKTPGGFAFKQQAAAEQWAASALGGAVAPDGAAPEVSPASVPLTQGIAERLRKLAEGMTKDIEHAHRPMTQNLTPKRQREYRSRVIDGNNLQRGQKALLALADAWDAGTVPAALQGLRTKSQILPMVRVKTDSNGYYDVYETGEYADKSEAAVALRALVEAWESPESKARDDERSRQQRIEQMEHALVGLDIPGFFPTPRPVIERMLDEAEIEAGHTVLEPSAGKGDIADAIRERHGEEVDLTVVEISHRLADILRAKGYELAAMSDFLDLRGSYDRIAMNPPFENGQDIDHIRHAYRLLAPGGRVVAIMSNGPFFRTDRKSTEFREWLDTMEASVEDLPAGTFNGKDSFRQTGVASKLVVIEKAAVQEGDGDEAAAEMGVQLG